MKEVTKMPQMRTYVVTNRAIFFGFSEINMLFQRDTIIIIIIIVIIIILLIYLFIYSFIHLFIFAPIKVLQFSTFVTFDLLSENK